MVSSISGSFFNSEAYSANLSAQASSTAAQLFSSRSSATNFTAKFDSDTVTISSPAQEKLAQDSQANASTAGAVPAGRETPHFVKAVDLPDGSEALQLGDLDASKGYFHKQGQNDLGFLGTCGLVSCGDVANQFGDKVTENEVVHYAIDNGLTTVVSGNPAASGGTTMSEQAAVLSGLGIPSHIDLGDTLEGLGRQLEEGHGVVMEVNAGELWNRSSYYDNGAPNHAVTLTGVAVDQQSGKALGIWINDSGSGNYQRYISADDPAIKNWNKNGEPTVVTNIEHN